MRFSFSGRKLAWNMQMTFKQAYEWKKIKTTINFEKKEKKIEKICKNNNNKPNETTAAVKIIKGKWFGKNLFSINKTKVWQGTDNIQKNL